MSVFQPALPGFEPVLWQRLGNGVSRHVYDLGDGAVIKIPFRNDEWINLREAQVWSDADTALRPHLAPVLAVSPTGSWLVMRKASDVGSWQRADRLHDAVGGRIGDLHGNNVGVVDGRDVIIDYAPPW